MNIHDTSSPFSSRVETSTIEHQGINPHTIKIAAKLLCDESSPEELSFDSERKEKILRTNQASKRIREETYPDSFRESLEFLKEKKLALDPNGSQIISYIDFQTLLNQAQTSSDPFTTLTKFFTSTVTPKGEVWTRFIQLQNEACVECQLSIDEWDSTCFFKKREGNFRFIEVFEYDPATCKTDDKHLISIRISEKHDEGEWLWVNRGKNISGRQSKSISEDLSRAMKIKTCFLGDSATVNDEDEDGSIDIRIPLQVMTGNSYYSPTFTLYNTSQLIESNVETNGTVVNICFDQNIVDHERELSWLRQLKVDILFHEILKNKTEEQHAFASLLRRYQSNSNAKKIKNTPSLLKNCNWSLEKLMVKLYKAQKKSAKGLEDYKWAYFNLLDYTNVSVESDIQKRYAWITEKLFFNNLMIAHFNSTSAF